MAQIKTDNSYLADKVALRCEHLPQSPIVLDCYAGDGTIWTWVEKQTRQPIERLPIDTRNDLTGLYLPGDNLGFLETLDLNQFNVIDLDAYGVPFRQLQILFERNYRGVVFATFIQSAMGMMPIALLEQAGFTRAMIARCPTVVSRNGWKYFLEYLAAKGIEQIYHRSHSRKHYLYFDCSARCVSD